mmetsp:Transcript_20438/g.48719  ORF Transcript_20438/g.48719 Transcript_20438/m.48719 type:complete len:257 (+) Transcript_20438:2483-3253(+)
MVVGIARGQMADGRFGLHPHIGFVVVHLEQRLGGVAHLPDDDGGDLDRVTALVIDLDDRRVQVAVAQRDALLQRKRVGPAQAGAAVAADVGAEQRDGRGLVGVEHVEAGERQHARDDQRQAEQRRAAQQDQRADAAQPDAQGQHRVAVGGPGRALGDDGPRNKRSTHGRPVSKVNQSDITLGRRQSQRKGGAQPSRRCRPASSSGTGCGPSQAMTRRCGIERSQVTWRLASWRVAAMPRSRRLEKSPASSASHTCR